MVFVTNLSCV